MKYTTELYGLERFIGFMSENGYLQNTLLSGDVLYNE